MLCTNAEPPKQLIDWLEYTWVAHNALGFDAEGVDLLVTAARGLANPEWYDTMPLCRMAGYPASLDALGKIFLGSGKDAGKDALKMLYTAKVRGGEVVYPVGTLPLWRSMLQYNVKDVVLLKRIYTAIGPPTEPEVLSAHCAINQRGIRYDPQYLASLETLWEALEQYAGEECLRLTDGALGPQNIRSQPQVRKWVERNGVRLDSLARPLVEQFYDDPDSFLCGQAPTESVALVTEVLKLRQTLTRVGKAKLDRIKQMADSDNRVRDMLVYGGAHTGRWSGRGIQPHNFARGVSGFSLTSVLDAQRDGNLDLSRIRELAEDAKASVDDVLSTLTRPVFCGDPLAIADYAAIEARAVAWLADEDSLLAAFAADQDIYKQMASMIYGVEAGQVTKEQRGVGKVTVLGCGYSMSSTKFSAYCKSSRIDLEAVGVTAEQCVETYRNSYPKIAGTLSGRFRRNGLWQRYANVAKQVVAKRVTRNTGKCGFYMQDDTFCIRLPSGRSLHYHGASVEPRVPGYAALLGLTLEPRPTLVYRHPHGYEATLYGGLLTENISQAMCRDLLAHSLVLAEAAGIPVVLHVHDEIVAESDRLAQLLTLMSTPPAWATGFPLKVEGFLSPVYCKSVLPGYTELTAINGAIV